MKVDQIIESGILETYALGLCSAMEQREVESMLASSPELRAELAIIEAGLENWAMENAVAPPPQVKENLLQTLNFEASETSATKVINLRPYKVLVAASVTALVGSLIFNGVIWNKLQNAQSTIAELNDRNSVMAEDLGVSRTNYSTAKEELAFITNADVKVVELLSANNQGSERATIYWNRKSDEVVLAINSLPKPPEKKQYQLWAIVDGVPVDAGVFDIPEESISLQKMKSFKNAQAFAVTIENVGGSPTPSLETLTIIGNV
ncbi:MAG: anti-sigma factor [Flavobacteriales bacterium]